MFPNDEQTILDQCRSIARDRRVPSLSEVDLRAAEESRDLDTTVVRSRIAALMLAYVNARMRLEDTEFPIHELSQRSVQDVLGLYLWEYAFRHTILGNSELSDELRTEVGNILAATSVFMAKRTYYAYRPEFIFAGCLLGTLDWLTSTIKEGLDNPLGQELGELLEHSGNCEAGSFLFLLTGANPMGFLQLWDLEADIAIGAESTASWDAPLLRRLPAIRMVEAERIKEDARRFVAACERQPSATQIAAEALRKDELAGFRQFVTWAVLQHWSYRFCVKASDHGRKPVAGDWTDWLTAELHFNEDGVFNNESRQSIKTWVQDWAASLNQRASENFLDSATDWITRSISQLLRREPFTVWLK